MSCLCVRVGCSKTATANSIVRGTLWRPAHLTLNTLCCSCCFSFLFCCLEKRGRAVAAREHRDAVGSRTRKEDHAHGWWWGTLWRPTTPKANWTMVQGSGEQVALEASTSKGIFPIVVVTLVLPGLQEGALSTSAVTAVLPELAGGAEMETLVTSALPGRQEGAWMERRVTKGLPGSWVAAPLPEWVTVVLPTLGSLSRVAGAEFTNSVPPATHWSRGGRIGRWGTSIWEFPTFGSTLMGCDGPDCLDMALGSLSRVVLAEGVNSVPPATLRSCGGPVDHRGRSGTSIWEFLMI